MGTPGVDGVAVAGWGLHSEKAQASCGCLGLRNIVSHFGHFTIQASRLFWFEFQASQPQVFLPLTPSCCKHAQHLHLLKRLRAFETHNSILIQSKPKSMTLGSPLGPRLRWLKRERTYNTLSFPGNLSFNLQHARGLFLLFWFLLVLWNVFDFKGGS